MQFLRDLAGQLVSDDAAGDSLDVRKKVVHGFDFPFGAADGEVCAGALDEVVKIFLRVTESFAVGIFAFAADIEVGVESLLES